MRQINGILDYEKPDIQNMGAVITADFTNATAGLVNITGLSIPLLDHSTYAFEAIISAGVSADGNGCPFAVDFSGVGANIEAQIFGALTTASAIAERIAALATPTTALLTTASQAGAVLIRGIINTVANGGNLTIQCAHPTTGTSTIRIGSYLRSVKIE